MTVMITLIGEEYSMFTEKRAPGERVLHVELRRSET